MSIRAYQAVWDHSTHKGSKLVLMLAIADNANEEYFDAWPGADTLMQKLRMDLRYIYQMIAQVSDTPEVFLQKAKDGKPTKELIRLSSEGGKQSNTTTYHINLPGQTKPGQSLVFDGIPLIDGSPVPLIAGSPVPLIRRSPTPDQEIRGPLIAGSAPLIYRSPTPDQEIRRSVRNRQRSITNHQGTPRHTALQNGNGQNAGTTPPPPTPSPENAVEAEVIASMRDQGYTDEEMTEMIRRMRYNAENPLPQRRSRR